MMSLTLGTHAQRGLQ